jgi:hypothetical protein
LRRGVLSDDGTQRLDGYLADAVDALLIPHRLRGNTARRLLRAHQSGKVILSPESTDSPISNENHKFKRITIETRLIWALTIKMMVKICKYMSLSRHSSLLFAWVVSYVGIRGYYIIYC